MGAVVVEGELERGKVLSLQSEQWEQESVEQSQPQLVLPLLAGGRGRRAGMAGGGTERGGPEQRLCHLKQVVEVVRAGRLAFFVWRHQGVVSGDGGGGGLVSRAVSGVGCHRP